MNEFAQVNGSINSTVFSFPSEIDRDTAGHMVALVKTPVFGFIFFVSCWPLWSEIFYIYMCVYICCLWTNCAAAFQNNGPIFRHTWDSTSSVRIRESVAGRIEGWITPSLSRSTATSIRIANTNWSRCRFRLHFLMKSNQAHSARMYVSLGTTKSAPKKEKDSSKNIPKEPGWLFIILRNTSPPPPWKKKCFECSMFCSASQLQAWHDENYSDLPLV